MQSNRHAEFMLERALEAKGTEGEIAREVAVKRVLGWNQSFRNREEGENKELLRKLRQLVTISATKSPVAAAARTAIKKITAFKSPPGKAAAPK